MTTRHTPRSDLAAELHDLALRAVNATSPMLMDRFRSTDLRISTKSSAADVVTDADIESERIIRELILTKRPLDGFVGEEGTAIEGTSGINWVLDPIDSTANFARGIPIWSVSLAAKTVDGALVGVVAFPPGNEVISGTRESGVLLNSAKVGPGVRHELAASMIAVGWGPRSGGRRQERVAGSLIPAVGKVRSPGSPALGLAWTAIGRFDAAFYEMDFNQWDVAAGAFLCECAGLLVRSSQPQTPNTSPRLLAAPEHLFEALRRFVLD